MKTTRLIVLLGLVLGLSISLTTIRAQQGGGAVAIDGDDIEGRRARPVQDDAFPAPRSTGGDEQHFRERLHDTRRQMNGLHPAIGEEADRPAVGRPERKNRVAGAFEPVRVRPIQLADP